MKPSHTKKPSTSISYGDIFRIGNHLLACGNAQDADLVNKLIGKEKIKLVCVDPPYSVDVVASKKGFSKIRVDKDIINDEIKSDPEYAEFTKKWLLPILPHLEPKNSFYIFNSDAMLFALRDGMEKSRIHFSQLLIWIKNQPVIGRKDYLPQHELIAYGWYGKHRPLRAKDKTVLPYPKPHRSVLHPTQKPVGLIRRLILNSTNIGDVVYDCFVGSGTTAVACEQTKRRSISIELDPDYCQVVIDRMEKLFGLKAERIKNEKR